MSLQAAWDLARWTPELGYNLFRHGFLPAGRSTLRTGWGERPTELPWIFVGDFCAGTLGASGPVLTKIGQILATRSDVLPAAVCTRLEHLYSAQKPMPADELASALGAAFPEGKPFESFEDEPLGVGSVGQVHRARLVGGEAVVVKILRPRVEERIRRDLGALETLLAAAMRLGFFRPSLRDFVLKSFRNLGDALLREADLSLERQAFEDFGKRLESNPRVKVPRVYPDHSGRGVLVMEELVGESLAKLRARAPQDPEAAKTIGALALREILRQVFEDGAFHADPHGGNLILLPDGRLGLIDLGLTGELSPEERKAISKAIRAFFSSDPEALMNALLSFGELPDDFSPEAFEKDVRDVVGRHRDDLKARLRGQTSVEELETTNALEAFVTELFAAAAKHGLRVPESAALLIKSFVTVEGVARGLDPELDLAKASRDVLFEVLTPKWMRRFMWKRT